MAKTVELETRVARLEASLREARETLDEMTKRQRATQAELDHFVARFGKF